MKRILALVMTGVLMLSPMTVSAATSVDAEAVRAAAEAAEAASRAAQEAARAAQAAAQAAQTAAQASANKGNTSYGTYVAGGIDNRVTNNYTYKITIKTTGNKTPKVNISGGGSGSGGGKVSVTEPPYLHTVLNAPGLDEVIPVGQGGKLILNGKITRATMVLREADSGMVSSAQILAARIGGSCKNVIQTYAHGVRYSKCQVDFKVYGCKDGDIYKVYQMGGNGTWDEVQVDEVREGHVLCTMYKTGTLAFIKMN